MGDNGSAGSEPNDQEVEEGGESEFATIVAEVAVSTASINGLMTFPAERDADFRLVSLVVEIGVVTWTENVRFPSVQKALPSCGFTEKVELGSATPRNQPPDGGGVWVRIRSMRITTGGRD